MCIYMCVWIYLSVYLSWAKALQEGGGTKGHAMLSMVEDLLGDAVSTEIAFSHFAPFSPHLHLCAGPVTSPFGVIHC